MKAVHGLLFLLMIGACTDKYNAPVHIPATGYLVVDGFINVGGVTDIGLSRATGLDSPYVNPEMYAAVSVESDNGDTYPLTEMGNGHYVVDQIPVVSTQKYRVRIQTSLGKQYLSDFTPVNVSPPIDSVSWKTTSDGVQVYVSTHGAPTDARNFQWTFGETWIYNSFSPVEYLYQDYGQMYLNLNPFQWYTCWSSDSSTNIAIASSNKLSQNTIYEYPLTFIPYGTTNKLMTRYSILVKQHALSEDWYEWAQRIQKNTEQLGSIFDAQPSAITGNIHSTSDASEPVIGFMGCSTQTEQRIFIDRSQLPYVPIYNPYAGCEKHDTILNDPDSVAAYFGGGAHLALGDLHIGMIVTHYVGGSPGCLDCRVLGGTTTKPDFWQ